LQGVLPVIPRVIVIIRGGVAEVLRKDRGVELVLVDYDVEGDGGRSLDKFMGDDAIIDTLSADDEVREGGEDEQDNT